MSKILCISDIHIHDYSQRNPSEKFRLYQTRTVAQNIVSVAQTEGCSRIMIAGDVLEKSVIRPYIQAETKLFLDTLMRYFEEGFIIWGNHDQDNKGNDQHFNDSCLSVMLPPNLYYADKQTHQIENLSMAFCNWMPEFDLGFIKDPVDVLFTHATICYSESDQVRSQILDESKFNLCISGDIHRPAQKGKFVSIGIPQKCKMGDFDQSTGVVIDCQTKEWKWVDLNPSDNLMKFEYTNSMEEEGWDESQHTWKVFKRDTVNLDGNVREIEIPAWEEIDHLISGIITGNGLEEIHRGVLSNIKNIDSNEVDFNFTMTRLYCKNWRSIDECELFFDDMDKILIVGKNGSGKSSLLSAIRYAFLENRFLKDYIQFGTKECVTEVDFIYQGNQYRIQRGGALGGRSGKYGFWIYDKVSKEYLPQKYNNKKEFEEDMWSRFPFIKYMGIYFFDIEHSQLIGQLKDEERTEIISKFFKLDKIQTFNEEAERILGEQKKAYYKWKEEVDKGQESLKYIQGKLSLISLPNISRSELEEMRANGLECQRRAREWDQYVIQSAQLTAKKEQLEETYKKKYTERATCRSHEEIEEDIRVVNEEMNEINTNQIPELKTIDREINLLKSKIKKMNEEGNELYQKLVGLDTVKMCPTCGKPLDTPLDLESTRADLEAKIGLLRVDIQRLDDELALKKSQAEDVPLKMLSLTSRLQELQIQINTYNSEKNKLYDLNNELVMLDRNLKGVEATINSTIIPPQVSLPPMFMEEMSKIEQGIQSWIQWESFEADRQSIEGAIQGAQQKLQEVLDSVSGLEEYVKLTGTKGKIWEEIMNRLAEQFSDNQVKYEVDVYTKNRKDHLDLVSFYNNKGNWVNYGACSSGQKTVLDIHFLSKIVTRMGLLVMDEFLKHLDPANHDVCIDMISQCNVGCIMLSSHMESISNFNNKTCSLSLNENGSTIITLS